ncbi:hypothetical protein INT45_006872 [Circinella minor]|uniref:Heterokaryon incompatibility domain-containing protein n=1 Tax=Circinella minor TaxID=1195481 RepID=A0A8H7VLT7_9FUNG|nr:hypothetical protein INT45_006872 [Circinella minor]
MPSYLVCISDMRVVKGAEVDEGYCALSYSWNQSGEVLINQSTGKSYRIDQGMHKIIFSGKTVQKKPRGRKRTTDRSKFVKFEGLIQEICKDFNIKYIWYDQMCIDQENEKEKHREIRQMHKIYSNAHCTVALVPELGTLPYKVNRRHARRRCVDVDLSNVDTSQWMRRMWTLEETIMSSKILVVGRNTHSWGDKLAYLISSVLFDEKFDYDVSDVLFYAHTRTSTKKHDHVFALANIFPDIMKDIEINYKQDVQELMIKFYGLLAKKNLSILWFKNYRIYNTICAKPLNDSIKFNSIGGTEIYIPIRNFNLPSWTGVYGEPRYSQGRKTSFENYNVSGRILKITSRGLTYEQDRTEFLEIQRIKDLIPPFPQQDWDIEYCYGRPYSKLVIRVRSPVFTEEKLIMLESFDSELNDRNYEDIMETLRNLSHFWPIENLYFQWVSVDEKVSTSSFYFYDLTEPLQDSAQYVLLTEVLFESSENPTIESTKSCPVIKRDGNYYKAIGMCDMFTDSNFFDDFTLEEETFEIH